MDSGRAPTSYPLVLTDLAAVRCVVVGGGPVAERKVRGLLDGGARPVVISPDLTPALAGWREEGRLHHIPRRYRAGDLAGAWLAIAATDDRAVNLAVGEEGASLGILVNIADDPARGSFHTVATVRRGDLLLAVASGGGSPALAAHICDELERRYGEEYGRLLARLRGVREGQIQALTAAQRAAFWRRLPLDMLLDWLRAGQEEWVDRYLHHHLTLLLEEGTCHEASSRSSAPARATPS